MKITDIKTYIVGNEWKNWLFVHVETDEGITGLGEATLNGFAKTVEAAIHELKKFVIGEDPTNIERNVVHLLRNVYSDGGQIHGAAIAGIEYACWDILGKKLGLPVYQLLGGKFNDKLRVYANGWYRGGNGASDLAKQAKITVDKGYTALKFDPFGNAWNSLSKEELDHAMENVRAVREAVGDHIDLLIEGHNRFSVKEAQEIARRLQEYGITWFEAPVPPHRISSMVEVAKKSPVSIACGEDYHRKEQFAELLATGSVHIIQLEPQFLGMQQSKQVCAMVDAFGGVIAPHSAQGPLCSIAAAHLNTTLPNFFLHEIFDDFNDDWTKHLLSNPVEIRNGYLYISDEPGWGTTLNMDIVKEHPYQSGNYLPLFKEGWERRERVDEENV